MTGDRVPVRKTYKLYIGGEFPRSESGRTYPVRGPGGEVLAQAVRGSRKDLRDAVRAARAARTASRRSFREPRTAWANSSPPGPRTG